MRGWLLEPGYVFPSISLAAVGEAALVSPDLGLVRVFQETRSLLFNRRRHRRDLESPNRVCAPASWEQKQLFRLDPMRRLACQDKGLPLW